MNDNYGNTIAYLGWISSKCNSGCQSIRVLIRVLAHQKLIKTTNLLIHVCFEQFSVFTVEAVTLAM